MEGEQEKNFSYPNIGQKIPGVTDSSKQGNFGEETQPQKPVIHILDALRSEDNSGDAKNIRTFQSDISDAIKSDGISMIKVALAEKKRQEKQGTYDQILQDENKGGKFLKYIFIIFGILAVVSVAVYILLPKPPTAEQVAEQIKNEPLMYAEEFVNIDTDQKSPDDVERIIKRERDVDLPLGTMKGLVLQGIHGSSTSPLYSSELFSVLGTRASEDLVRSFEDKFMLGIYSYSPHEMFAILKVADYDNAFASMLQWEPFIESDFGSIFITKKPVANISQLKVAERSSTSSTQKVSSTTAQQTTTSTTSPALNNILFKRVFVDKVIDNRDVRALIDEDGSTAMLYGFIDKKTLVIASSEKSFREVIFRLTAGKIIR